MPRGRLGARASGLSRGSRVRPKRGRLLLESDAASAQSAKDETRSPSPSADTSSVLAEASSPGRSDETPASEPSVVPERRTRRHKQLPTNKHGGVSVEEDHTPGGLGVTTQSRDGSRREDEAVDQSPRRVSSVEKERVQDLHLLQQLLRACKQRKPWTSSAIMDCEEVTEPHPMPLVTNSDEKQKQDLASAGNAPASTWESVADADQSRAPQPDRPAWLSMLEQLSCVLHVYNLLTDAIFREACEEAFREEYFSRILRTNDRARIHSPLFEALRMTSLLDEDTVETPLNGCTQARQAAREGVLVCFHCKSSVSAARYAQHLEKCWGGGGRQSSRVAAVRLRQASARTVNESSEQLPRNAAATGNHLDEDNGSAGTDTLRPGPRASSGKNEGGQLTKTSASVEPENVPREGRWFPGRPDEGPEASVEQRPVSGMQTGFHDQGVIQEPEQHEGRPVSLRLPTERISDGNEPAEDEAIGSEDVPGRIHDDDADDNVEDGNNVDDDHDDDDDDDDDFTQRPPKVRKRSTSRRRPERRRRGR